MSCAEFIKAIQYRQDDARNIGSRITLIVLPLASAQMIMHNAKSECLSSEKFFRSVTGNVYLAGIKVLWSDGRLPRNEAWFRYENIKKV